MGTGLGREREGKTVTERVCRTHVRRPRRRRVSECDSSVVTGEAGGWARRWLQQVGWVACVV